MTARLGRHPALFVLVASAAFAVASPLARFARPVHPLTIAFARVAIAAIFLLVLDVRGVLRSVAAMRPRQRTTVAGAGAILAAHFGLFLWGLDTTSLPAAVSLVSLEPFSVVLCAWAIHRIRPTRLELCGVLLATVGAVFIGRGAGAGEHRILGDVLIIFAVVLYGFYVAVARGVRDVLPAQHYAALVYAGASLTLLCALPFALRFAPQQGIAWPIPAHAAVAILGLAFIPTVIGHTAVQTAARSLSPATVALVSPGETLGGLAIGAWLLHALPTRFETIGAVIIVAGAGLAIAGARKPEVPEAG